MHSSEEAKTKMKHKALIKVNPKHEARNTKQYQNSNFQNPKQKKAAAGGGGFCFSHLNFGHLNLFRISNFGFRIFFKF